MAETEVECLRLACELLCDLLRETLNLISYHSPKGDRLEVDLSIVRNKTLISENGIAVTILSKGTGTWTLILEFADGSWIDFEDTELEDSDILEWQFRRLKMTNSSQDTVVNPTFIIDTLLRSK